MESTLVTDRAGCWVTPVTRASLALALAAGLFAQTPPPPAPGTPPPAPVETIRWEQDYDAAMQRAANEKKPIFVAFLMDDEPANDETVKDHYRDPQIVKLLAQFVCLVGCIGEHKGTDPGCTKFAGLECSHHNAIEKKARKRWLVGDLVCTPQHVFCDPSGTVLRRKVYLITKVTLAKCLLLTLEECGIDTKGLKVDLGKDANGQIVDEERGKVDGWLADLDSKSLEVRERALSSLGYAEDPRALPAVLQRCGPKFDDATRMAAISALGRKGNFQAVERLTAMLGESKAPILARVAKSLEAIQMPESVPPLLAALKKEKRDRVVGCMLRAAAHSQPGNTEVRELCLKTLKTASAQLTGGVLIALGHLDTNEKIVSAVVPMLAQKNEEVRGLAAWTLGNHKTEASAKALQKLRADEKVPTIQKMIDSALRNCRGETVANYETMYWSFFSDYGM